MSRRFTLDGGPELEARIAADLDAIRVAVREAESVCPVAAVILGGGYGRGEGGVLRENGAETVYNDYDLFVVVPEASRPRRKALQARLRAAGEELGRAFGIHVDFGPPIIQRELSQLPYELMFMELREGHHVVIGPPDALGAMPRYNPERVPLIEGARLLMNRGTGLLLARRKLRAGIGDEEDRQFVVRNIHKAMLALGDVVLMRRDAYSPSCVRRRDFFEALDLRALPDSNALYARYREALEFKLHPKHEVPGGSALPDWHAEACRLFEKIYRWFEQERLGVAFEDWTAYSRLPQLILEDKTPRWLNVARNVRAGGWRCVSPARIGRPTLENLLRTLPHALYGPENVALEERYLRFWGQVC